MTMENGNGKVVRKGGEFLTKCTHPRGSAVMTLEDLLRLFLEAPRRQKERRLLGKLNQAHFSHKRNLFTSFQANVYSTSQRCVFT